MTDFLSALRNEQVAGETNVSVTENGAIGYKTTGKSLLDLNYMVSSLRNEDEQGIWKRFLSAYNENPDLAVAWLFFARDPRFGMGERRLFRVIFPRLADENPDLAAKLLRFIPEYGRWDDLIATLDSVRSQSILDAGFGLIRKQFFADLDAMRDHTSVSLLAKWLPSSNTSSKKTRRLASAVRNELRLTPRQYRKSLSSLREYIDVVERKMSANDWTHINYSAVPSKAMLNYRDAFRNHDEDGFSAYLEAVKSGDAKIHSGTLFPHEIVHAYGRGSCGWNHRVSENIDETLEAQWKALPNTVPPDKGTLVVVDGSGSMCSPIAGTSALAIEIAHALGLYFAERLTGPFKDHFITFSSSPRLIHVNPDFSLRAKLELIGQYEECSNTNIEKTFRLILDTAIHRSMKQEDLPANILMITDGEFDAMTMQYERGGRGKADQRLFDNITTLFEAAGYKLPRLVFWNVNSRTGTIPLIENELGVALVSGFSQNIADMVMSGKLDPWECLVDKLTGERYAPILKEVRSSYGRR